MLSSPLFFNESNASLGFTIVNCGYLYFSLKYYLTNFYCACFVCSMFCLRVLHIMNQNEENRETILNHQAYFVLVVVISMYIHLVQKSYELNSKHLVKNNSSRQGGKQSLCLYIYTALYYSSTRPAFKA